jgi:hypothetical protein
MPTPPPQAGLGEDKPRALALVALAKWMAGGSPEDGREASREAFQHHGQMAAERAAPLNEMTKHSGRRVVSAHGA